MIELSHAEFLALKAKRDTHRGSLYCLRLMRTLFATETIKAIGADAAMLVQWVALREDELRYREPVRAWNEQLESLLGFRSPKQLNQTRKHAVDSGWLVYHRENDRSIGGYLAMIPDRFNDLSCGSASSESFPNSEREAESINETLSENGKGNGKGSGKGSGKPSIPNPIPSPIKRTAERFTPPTVDDVREYAKTKGLPIDAERFVDFYQAKGWVVGKNGMKDWQAAVRNWARSQRDQAGKTLSPQTTKGIEYVN